MDYYSATKTNELSIHTTSWITSKPVGLETGAKCWGKKKKKKTTMYDFIYMNILEKVYL